MLRDESKRAQQIEDWYSRDNGFVPKMEKVEKGLYGREVHDKKL
jgi:hypothetical protein